MKIVIFDMDGTLVDSKRAICTTINSMRKRLNLNGDLDENLIINTINDPKKDPIFEFYGLEKVDANLKADFENEFKQNYAKFSKIYDGIFELLLDLKKINYKIAVASNAPLSTIKQILNFHKILDFFDEIVGVDENTPPKPDPTMLLKILNGAKYSVFIGDSSKDLIAAQKANINYINAIWGFGSEISGIKSAKNPNEILSLIA